MTSLETPIAPALDVVTARALLLEHFALDGALDPLPSERDQNFRVTDSGGNRWVLKIATPHEDAAFAMQAAVLRHVAEADGGMAVPHVRASRAGHDVAAVHHDGVPYRLRVVSWLDGVPLAETPRAPQQLEAVGRAAGRLTAALRSFGHPGAHRELDWDLARTLQARERLARITDPGRRAVIGRALDDFERRVTPQLPRMRHSVVHGDLNDWNILVDATNPQRVTGLIDFGDALFSVTVADLAIACAYTMLGASAPLHAAASVVAGFHAECPLEARELEVLLDLIRGRLCTSLTIAATRHALTDGANAYWFVSERPAWELIERLDRTNPYHATAIFRQACGLEPVQGSARVRQWIADNAHRLSPILGQPLERTTTHLLDWGNRADPVVCATAKGDTAAADAAYTSQARALGFAVGIGAWGEHRAIYTTDAFASLLISGARRDVHLGLDLFVDAGTALHTPLDATVVATADCNQPQDYGGVLLLEHRTDDGTPFRTLWGHLAPPSIAHWRTGDAVRAGQVVATLGSRADNGGWVPHLHLQLCCSGENDPAAIIGVGESAVMPVWGGLYPDPSLLAGLPPEALNRHHAERGTLLARRRSHLSPNLSLSYRQPLHIVRGRDVWLYDASGRAYLDCYNNVAHVGHCHPRVVAAIQSQTARLNTNTRYLHENILEYAERLACTLPKSLSVCFFTCSGSEANELALRLARAHTGRKDTLVLDWAYHGSTTSLVEISPYKYKHRGGQGRAAHVHEAPVPDPYRAPADWPISEAGPRYAQQLAAILSGGVHPACFIAETIPSCAGQVFIPHGFLRDAFASVRQAGGVCILDEVQVGFGRVGQSMWAFTEHDVVPDIVTMGKPIGNGHPMGAVVTTREIAASFANGLEYFNTFGGNPVSCAAGLAVLDVLKEEDLLANATVRGAELMAGLQTIAERDTGIGDVRGRGLFIGVELVTDRASKTPDTARASNVVNRCRDLGLLLGTDGPFDNVLKVRPAMTFQRNHVDLFLSTLSEALRSS